MNYRETYVIDACNGIRFNHESPTRGEFAIQAIVLHRARNAGIDLGEELRRTYNDFGKRGLQ